MYGWTILDATALNDDSIDLTNANWHKDGSYVLMPTSRGKYERLDCFVWRTSSTDKVSARKEVKEKMTELEWFSDEE